MVAGDFRVVQDEIGAFASDHGARLGQGEDESLIGTCQDGQYDVEVVRQAETVVDGRQVCHGGSGIGLAKGGHGGDNHGFVDAPLHLDNVGLAAPGTTKLHLRMLRNQVILKNVLLSTVGAASLHSSTLTRRGRQKVFSPWGGAALVTWPCGIVSRAIVLRLTIRNHAGVHLCLNIFPVKN